MKSKQFLISMLLYGGVTGGARLLPILLLPFYLEVLTPEEYGRVEVLIAFYNFIVIFGSLQLETAVQRFYYKSTNKVSFIFNVTTIVFILSSFFCFLIAYFSDSISNYFFLSPSESISVILIGICGVFYNASTILLTYFRFSERESYYYILILIQVLASSLSTYYFVIGKGFGVLGYFLGMLFGWFIVFLLSVFVIRAMSKKSFCFDFEYGSHIIGFSIPQIPARLGSYFIQFGNRFFVLKYFGVQSVALLGLALKFSLPLQLLYIAFTMSWYPFLYKNEDDKYFHEKINRILKIILIVVFACFISIDIVSGYVIESYFDKSYHEVKSLVLLAIVPTGFLVIKEVLESGIKISGKTKYISYSFFVSALTVLFFLFFSKTLKDILLSSVAGAFVLFFLSWFFSESNSSVRYSRVYLFLFFSSILFYFYLFN